MMLSEMIEQMTRHLERNGDMPVRCETLLGKYLRHPVLVYGTRGDKGTARKKVSRGGTPVLLISAE